MERKNHLILYIILLAGLLSLHPQSLLAQITPPQHLDSFVKKVRTQFNVPGISLAIVKDGEVVTAKGYGIREIGKPAPVNAQTLFGIASNTKAFTATALGILVEEGKIEWDAPVIKYLPWFKLSDPYVTHEITVRDLLVHRSGLGLGAGDLLWWPGTTYSREEIVRRLRYVPLATGFRSAYAYDNVLYMVAGEVIEAVSGQSWEDFVANRILAKIGMNDSNVRHSDAAEGPNAATPHAPINGEVQPVQPFTGDVTNPAGGINASARDMAKWLIVQLDSGRVDQNTRLFTPQTTRQLWSVVTPMPIGDRPPSIEILKPQFKGYGLGFILRDYRGYKIVTHTGSLPGYVSKVTMIPELKLGVAVLTNQESKSAYKAITYHILDYYLGTPNKDWITAFKKADKFHQSKTDLSEEKITLKRDSTLGPSLPI
ncbi:MAG TPA: serine hydrolase domain-containing protein, partial [Balneolaceae bacterium]|nr:serine hydrolase domain-containing protein [Balneolaceae bacterium]